MVNDRHYFNFLIKRSFLKGAFRDGNLISWFVEQYPGCVGTLFTKPEERRHGLAALLNIHMAEKLLQQRERIYCFVLNNNTASLKLLQKLGYKKTCDVDWLIVSPQ